MTKELTASAPSAMEIMLADGNFFTVGATHFRYAEVFPAQYLRAPRR